MGRSSLILFYDNWHRGKLSPNPKTNVTLTLIKGQFSSGAIVQITFNTYVICTPLMTDKFCETWSRNKITVVEFPCLPTMLNFITLANQCTGFCMIRTSTMKAVTDIFNLFHVNVPFLCLWFSNKFQEV